MREPNKAGQTHAVHPSRTCYRSSTYQETLLRLARFARDPTAPILLQGESGTGKTRLAKYVHSLSPRKHGAFQRVVLSAVDDGVASSELFGHVAGAFTDARTPRAGAFASSNGGTLFLDEIGKASPAVQGRLLHAIEYLEISPVGSDRITKVDARIIAATNVALDELASAGSFLPDLNARLRTFIVRVPPLRERRADIPQLVMESVRSHAAACGYDGAIPEIELPLMRALQRAPWPNNLRELDATVHRLLLEADGDARLGLRHCTDVLSHLVTGRADIESLAAEQIQRAVQRAGSLSGAARLLGVDRKTLRLRLRDVGQPKS